MTTQPKTAKTPDPAPVDLSTVPPKELLAEIRRRYPQAQFREPLDKIEAQLA